MYTNRSHLACHGYTHWSLRSISGQRKATQIKVDRRLLGCIMMYRHVSFGSSQNEVSVILFFSRAPDILADHLLPRVAVQLELPAGFNWLLGWGQLVMCLFFICSKEKWNSTCWNFSFDLFLFPSFEGCSSCFYICGFAVVHLSCQIHMFSFHRFHHVSSISPLADVFLVCTCAPCSFYTMETRAFEVSFWDVPALMGKSSGHP